MIWFIIVVALIVASPYIARWISRLFQQWVARKIQNRLREAMGIPPETREERRARNAEERQRRRTTSRPRSASIVSLRRLLQEYATDIEFIEIREYSSRTEIHPEPGGGARVVFEEQVTDAEYLILQPGGPTEFEEPAQNKFKFWKRK
ncbi:MAG: hypothetical protein HDR95_04770 [Bacteroides sp.]|nr:hypothetical protein [Bacteroides sp.]